MPHLDQQSGRRKIGMPSTKIIRQLMTASGKPNLDGRKDTSTMITTFQRITVTRITSISKLPVMATKLDISISENSLAGKAVGELKVNADIVYHYFLNVENVEAKATKLKFVQLPIQALKECR